MYVEVWTGLISVNRVLAAPLRGTSAASKEACIKVAVCDAKGAVQSLIAMGAALEDFQNLEAGRTYHFVNASVTAKSYALLGGCDVFFGKRAGLYVYVSGFIVSCVLRRGDTGHCCNVSNLQEV